MRPGPHSASRSRKQISVSILGATKSSSASHDAAREDHRLEQVAVGGVRQAHLLPHRDVGESDLVPGNALPAGDAGADRRLTDGVRVVEGQATGHEVGDRTDAFGLLGLDEDASDMVEVARAHGGALALQSSTAASACSLDG